MTDFVILKAWKTEIANCLKCGDYYIIGLWVLWRFIFLQMNLINKSKPQRLHNYNSVAIINLCKNLISKIFI